MDPGGLRIRCHVKDKGVMLEIHPRTKTQPFGANRQPRNQLARRPQSQIIRACRPGQRIAALRLADDEAAAFFQVAKPCLDAVGAATAAGGESKISDGQQGCNCHK